METTYCGSTVAVKWCNGGCVLRNRKAAIGRFHDALLAVRLLPSPSYFRHLMFVVDKDFLPLWNPFRNLSFRTCSDA
jgi:hypothetical protein